MVSVYITDDEGTDCFHCAECGRIAMGRGFNKQNICYTPNNEWRQTRECPWETGKVQFTPSDEAVFNRFVRELAK